MKDLLFLRFGGPILEPDEEFAVLLRNRILGQHKAALLALGGLVVVLLGRGSHEMHPHSFAPGDLILKVRAADTVGNESQVSVPLLLVTH